MPIDPTASLPAKNQTTFDDVSTDFASEYRELVKTCLDEAKEKRRIVKQPEEVCAAKRQRIETGGGVKTKSYTGSVCD